MKSYSGIQTVVTALTAAIFLSLAGRVAAQDNVPRATNLWALKISEKSCSSSPALAPDGTIYQATFDGTLLAVTPDGRVSWKFDTGTETEITSSPAVADDGTIYFGSRNRKFYAVTPDGKLKWTFPTGGWIDSSPAIAADGTIYFGSWDGNFYALNANGTQKWKFAAGAIIISSPAIGTDGTIYFGALDHQLYALAPDGKVKWTFLAGGQIVSSPAIGPDGTIYIPATDGNLYYVTNEGKERLHVHSGGYTKSSPVLDPSGNLYVAGSYVNGSNSVGLGEFVFSPAGQRLPGGSGLACLVDGAAVAVTGEVYWSRPWRTLQAFRSDNQVDGQILWQADLPANVSASPVVSEDGVVYVTDGRFLYAFHAPEDGLPLAHSSWPMFRADPRHTGRVRQ